MPHYRKLWKKTTTSEDIQAMPDDTTRLAWTWLPTALDREGRGIYSGAWIRANVFPLREDVTNRQCVAMLDWWTSHGMIMPYEVHGRKYFVVPTWVTYQGDCTREASSEIPPPPQELVTSYSRPGLDAIIPNSGTLALAQGLVLAQAPAQAPASAPEPAPEQPTSGATAPRLAAPVAFGGWLERVNESDNCVAVLREMHATLFPGRDPPEFGYIGVVARAVGGAGRLAELMWQCSSRPPTGDVLAYCRQAAKGQKRSNGSDDGLADDHHKFVAAVEQGGYGEYVYNK